MRQACGGNGFLNASGMVTNFTDFAPSPTYEGTTVLML